MSNFITVLAKNEFGSIRPTRMSYTSLTNSTPSPCPSPSPPPPPPASISNKTEQEKFKIVLDLFTGVIDLHYFPNLEVNCFWDVRKD